MNNLSKFIMGWFIWTIGVFVYAHLGTYWDLLHPSNMTLIEFTYGLMTVAYFIGVPILTGVWIVEGGKR